MSFFSRPLLASLALASAATLLAACDYSYSPGKNPQFKEGFNGTPTYTNAEVNRDSVNFKQTVKPPTGEGSATAIKKGTATDQLNSAPVGKSAVTPQDASGKPASVNQADPTNAAATTPAANKQ